MLGRYTTGAYTLLGPWASLASEHSTRCSEEIRPAVLALAAGTAGVPGLEPRLTEPESVVLPITPYPMGV